MLYIHELLAACVNFYLELNDVDHAADEEEDPRKSLRGRRDYKQINRMINMHQI